jgi:ABC-2 type transport system permease protein
MFRGIWTIFKRELGQYFTSPIAYFVAFAILVLVGVLFNVDLGIRVFNGLPADGAVPLYYIGFLMIFLAPLLTMRLIAEETREGTLELLLTLPVRDGDIVIGKFLGAWAFYTVILLISVVFELILLVVGQPDLGVIVSGYLGLWLFGGAVLALGLMFSAITENQIVAGLLGMAATVIMWLGQQISLSLTNPAITRLVRQMSIEAHFTSSFLRGIVRAEDVFFYIALIAGCLFITTRLVEWRRWR